MKDEKVAPPAGWRGMLSLFIFIGLALAMSYTHLIASPQALREGQIAPFTVISPVEAASPFDTLAPAVAQIEAFVAHLLASISDETRERIERLEAIRSANAVTLDAPMTTAQAEAVSRNFPGPKVKKTGTLA